MRYAIWLVLFGLLCVGCPEPAKGLDLSRQKTEPSYRSWKLEERLQPQEKPEDEGDIHRNCRIIIRGKEYGVEALKRTVGKECIFTTEVIEGKKYITKIVVLPPQRKERKKPPP